MIAERVRLPSAVKSDIETHLAEMYAQTDMNVLSTMKDILNRTFGEERNQIVKPSLESIEKALYQRRLNPTLGDIISAGLLSYRVIVLFPEVEVRNSRNASIKVRDLYTEFGVNPDGTLIPGVLGVVAAATRDQISAGYQHSHLRRTNFLDLAISKFCLGTGPIVQSQLILQDGFDEIEFQLFCLHLGAYVAWESLEGVPHILMASVLNAQFQFVVPPSLDGEINMICAKVYQLLARSLSDREIAEFLEMEVASSGAAGVLPRERLGTQLGELINTSHRQVTREIPKHFLICYKTENGQYMCRLGDENAVAAPVVYSDKTLITFKGNDIVFRLIEDQTEIQSQKYANPHITDGVCKWLSRQINRVAPTAQRAIATHNTTDNINQIAGADTPTLQQG